MCVLKPKWEHRRIRSGGLNIATVNGLGYESFLIPFSSGALLLIFPARGLLSAQRRTTREGREQLSRACRGLRGFSKGLGAPARTDRTDTRE
jgi:hypothetical protein